MEGQSKPLPSGEDEFVKSILALLSIATVAALLFVAMYLLIALSVGGAIYLGIKLGSSGQIGRKPLHRKVYEIETEKQEHLKELEGESDDLKELVAGKFENDKMDLYREDDRPEPLVSVNADAVKTIIKKVVKRAAQKATEKTK